MTVPSLSQARAIAQVGGEFVTYIQDTFDVLYAEGAT